MKRSEKASGLGEAMLQGHETAEKSFLVVVKRSPVEQGERINHTLFIVNNPTRIPLDINFASSKVGDRDRCRGGRYAGAMTAPAVSAAAKAHCCSKLSLIYCR